MNTKHKENCKRVFKNYDATCPRCNELAQGAPAREGWNDVKKAQDAQRSRWIAEHDCKQNGCGNVCTAFDW